MEKIIIVCIRGVKPWAICQLQDNPNSQYYSIISKYKTFAEAVRVLKDNISKDEIPLELATKVMNGEI